MITAPGAPLTGLALPVSTIPSPSPNHHTPSAQAIEAASASAHRAAARRSPSPAAPGWWRRSRSAARVMLDERGVPADRAGDDARVAGRRARQHRRLNALENMNDWYCSTPSSSHIPASASCSSRLTSGAHVAASAPAPSLLRHAGWTPAAAISLIRLSSASPAPGSQARGLTPFRDRRSAPLMATREFQEKILGPSFTMVQETTARKLSVISCRGKIAAQLDCCRQIASTGLNPLVVLNKPRGGIRRTPPGY